MILDFQLLDCIFLVEPLFFLSFIFGSHFIDKTWLSRQRIFTNTMKKMWKIKFLQTRVLASLKKTSMFDFYHYHNINELIKKMASSSSQGHDLNFGHE